MEDYRSINESLIERDCPRCKSNQYKFITTGKDYLHSIEGEFSAVECIQCGLRYLNPVPSDIAKYYPLEYAPYADTGTAKKESIYKKILKSPFSKWINRINLTPDYVGNGKILEIGCASGHRLMKLRQDGWIAIEGIEMSAEASKIAQGNGFNVYCDTVENILPNLKDDSYDAIIMSMVIEHLADPYRIVNEINRILKPNGQFILSTVVYDSLEYKIFNKFWPGYDFPRHLIYFTKEDIIKLLKGAGFNKIDITYQFAPQDFYRPAEWRNNELDKFTRFYFKTKLGLFTHIILAALKKTSRISVFCKK